MDDKESKVERLSTAKTSRRSFLKGGAAIAGAALVGAAVKASPVSAATVTDLRAFNVIFA